MTRSPRFLSDESGAVTIDWTVLTVAVLGIGLAVTAVVTVGVQSQADAASDHVATESIAYTSFDQQQYSDAYQAALAVVGTHPNGKVGGTDGAGYFAKTVEQLEGFSDNKLTNMANGTDNALSILQERIDGLKALDPATATGADIAPFVPAWSPEKAQEILDRPQWDAAALIAHRIAILEFQKAKREMVQDLAAEKGLVEAPA